ncbi:MAG TPA: hypothetical protein VK280_07910 [Streptosporangiaceae bacterium]|nr:hypothetical protein [Streptosporangiaceae bacterium]
MTYGQAGVTCPQCGSAAAVHSVAEWAAMAQGPMGGPGPQPGYGPPQPGFPDPSQYQPSGFPDPSQYQQPGFPDPPQGQPPGYPAGPPPAQPPGYPAEPWQSQPPPRTSWSGEHTGFNSVGDDIADAALGAATKFIGRAIGRRVRRTFEERVVPAMAARQEAVLRERMAVAQRHPDLCACLNDQVVFLAGGTRVLPLASALGVRTVEQSDVLVAQLRS